MIRHWRQRRLDPEIAARSKWYDPPQDPVERRAIQLRDWNREWARIVSDVPYYAELRRRLSLAVGFASWEQFVALVPPTTRTLVQQCVGEMRSRSRSPDLWRATGGSTAQPVQIPVWRSEVRHAVPDLWLARRWYGIRPSSPLFMIWGHSHLLGRGLPGWVNARWREVQDRLLRYYRFSAYDMRQEKLREAGEALLRYRPEYVLGYSVALDLFARANADRRPDFHGLKLKAVIGAAEAFPAPDSAQLIGDVLGAPVGMEYGSVETLLLAHTHPSGGYAVLWRSYFLEAEPNAEGSAGVVRVTSLYPRCFPLVRYELGDEIEFSTAMQRMVLGIERFSRVRGRCNDYVVLANGSTIHSEVFTHAVRACPEVAGYQVVQSGAELSLRLTLRGTPGDAWSAGIRERLTKVDRELGAIRIEIADKLAQTVAGKTPMIIRRP